MRRVEQPTVAHCVLPYLFGSGSWVYNQLIHAEIYRPIVLTFSTENLDIFPFHPVFAYQHLDSLGKAILCLSRLRISGGMQPYFEQVLRGERVSVMHVH